MMKFSQLIVAALVLVAGCDFTKQDFKSEREDRNFRSAMADYQAGRLDAAIAGFEKAAKSSPANVSARFQLAVLLQDVKKDYLGAYCAFREYLMQCPEGDKSSIVRTRLQTCEKAMAMDLAAKYKLDGVESQKIIADLNQQLKDKDQRLATSEKELQALRERHAALSEERDRLVDTVKNVGKTDAEEQVVKTEVNPQEVKALLEEEDPEFQDKTQIVKDVKALQAEEKSEIESGSSLLPVQTAEMKAKRQQLQAKQEAAKREVAERERRRHPPEYIVQEGDTLYRLAERFYGRISAWKTIRDANKAVISNDGRLRTGTRLTLPYGENK